MSSVPSLSARSAAHACASTGASGSGAGPGPRGTVLRDLHTGAGACFTDFAGWTMPLRYGSEIGEHHAVRRAAAVFDLSHMGEIEIAGRGAAALLEAALVSDISRIAVGRAKYTMICDDAGGIIDDVVVYHVAESVFLLVANAANTATVLAQLREHAGEVQARVNDVTEDWCLIAVQGPASPLIVAAAAGRGLPPLRYYAVHSARLLGHDVLLARTGYTGEDGFEIYCRPDHAADVWTGLLADGAPHGLVPAGLACRDSLRLEAGMPLYGRELTRGVTPFEAGLGRIVALGKRTAFTGQSALRARHACGPRFVLVGLSSGERRSPRAGHRVRDRATGGEIGHVTSGMWSPTLGHAIAMAYILPEYAEPGTDVAVDVRGRNESLTVVPLPFYRRQG